MSGATWPDEIVERAIKMHKGGLSYAEIGNAIGRKGRSVQEAIIRYRARQSRHFYLSYLDGPPIGVCKEQESLLQNAVTGSERLRDEIRRVFG